MKQLVVQRMTRLVRGKRANDIMAAHEQVADGVQHFVLDELVVVAQAIGVEHLVVVHDDGVV